MKKTASAHILALWVLLFLLGCADKGGRQEQSTVSVFGVGTVLARPDIIGMDISLSRIAQTTRQAQEEVSDMVRQTLAILKDERLEDRDITTASLRFSPEYEYRDGRRVLLGQKAEQALAFSIEDVNGDAPRVSRIIDRLITINGIELRQMNFSVKNNADLFARSRELAYQKALEKAGQYAALSGLRVVRTLRISEEDNQQISPANNRMFSQMNYAGEAASAAGSTVLPTGDLEITTRISAVFLLE